jgi:uncharacterized metal-binding protein
MSTDVAVAEKTPGWVQVAVLGDDLHQLDYRSDMTVANALALAEVDVRKGLMVQVNGREAQLSDPLERNSVVQVTTKVQNG